VFSFQWHAEAWGQLLLNEEATVLSQISSKSILIRWLSSLLKINQHATTSPYPLRLSIVKAVVLNYFVVTVEHLAVDKRNHD